MIAVFAVTCVIGLTVLIIKRDSATVYHGAKSPLPTLALANPATKNCLERLGGTVIEKIDAEKNVWSYCSLSNGKICEVWELMKSQVCLEPPVNQQAL